MPPRSNEPRIRDNNNARTVNNGSGRNYSRPHGNVQSRNGSISWVNREVTREPLAADNLEHSRDRNTTRGGVEQSAGSQQRGERVNDQLIQLN